MRKSQRKKQKRKSQTKRYLGGKLNNAYPSPGLQFKYNAVTANTPKIQRGGVTLTPSNSVTSFVGNPWTPSISGWPGVYGSSNYLPPNNYPTDVQLAIKYNNYI